MTLLEWMGDHPVLTVVLVTLVLIWLEGVVGAICITKSKRK